MEISKFWGGRRAGDVRLRVPVGKQFKDAGSLNSSAIQATEDAEMRRPQALSGVRTQPPPTPLEERAALVFAEDLAHRAADLADRGVGFERGADRVEEVAVAAGDVAQGLELGLDLGLIAVLLEGLEAGELALLGL